MIPYDMRYVWSSLSFLPVVMPSMPAIAAMLVRQG